MAKIIEYNEIPRETRLDIAREIRRVYFEHIKSEPYEEKIIIDYASKDKDIINKIKVPRKINGYAKDTINFFLNYDRYSKEDREKSLARLSKNLSHPRNKAYSSIKTFLQSYIIEKEIEKEIEKKLKGETEIKETKEGEKIEFSPLEINLLEPKIKLEKKVKQKEETKKEQVKLEEKIKKEKIKVKKRIFKKIKPAYVFAASVLTLLGTFYTTAPELTKNFKKSRIEQIENSYASANKILTDSLENITLNYEQVSSNLEISKKTLEEKRKEKPLIYKINREKIMIKRTYFQNPLNELIVKAVYGPRIHPIIKNKVGGPKTIHHDGVDLDGHSGDPIRSVDDGRVIYKRIAGGYGKMIEIEHEINGKKIRTRYGHLSKYGKGINAGQEVKKGQIIGYVGDTGLATGPHLHFEYHVQIKFSIDGEERTTWKHFDPLPSIRDEAEIAFFNQDTSSLKLDINYNTITEKDLRRKKDRLSKEVSRKTAFYLTKIDYLQESNLLELCIDYIGSKF